jgi:hypothetical protein
VSQEHNIETEIVSDIKKIFPEFLRAEVYNEKSDTLPYVFVGDFADYAVRELDKGNTEFAGRIVEYLNQNYEKFNDEGKNLFWVGFFEIVSGDMSWHKLLSTQLSDPVKNKYTSSFGKVS